MCAHQLLPPQLKTTVANPCISTGLVHRDDHKSDLVYLLNQSAIPCILRAEGWDPCCNPHGEEWPMGATRLCSHWYSRSRIAKSSFMLLRTSSSHIMHSFWIPICAIPDSNSEDQELYELSHLIGAHDLQSRMRLDELLRNSSRPIALRSKFVVQWRWNPT